MSTIYIKFFLLKHVGAKNAYQKFEICFSKIKIVKFKYPQEIILFLG